MSGNEKSTNYTYYLASLLMPERYDELIDEAEKMYDITPNQFVPYLIALYNIKKDIYLETVDEFLNDNKISKKFQNLVNKNTKNLESLRDYIIDILIEYLKKRKY